MIQGSDRLKANERNRHYRWRQANDIRVIPVEVDHDMINALIDAGLLDEDKSDDSASVGRAIVQAVRTWQ